MFTFNACGWICGVLSEIGSRRALVGRVQGGKGYCTIKQESESAAEGKRTVATCAEGKTCRGRAGSTAGARGNSAAHRGQIDKGQTTGPDPITHNRNLSGRKIDWPIRQ